MCSSLIECSISIISKHFDNNKVKKSIMNLHFEIGLKHVICKSLAHCMTPVLKISREKRLNNFENGYGYGSDLSNGLQCSPHLRIWVWKTVMLLSGMPILSSSIRHYFKNISLWGDAKVLSSASSALAKVIKGVLLCHLNFQHILDRNRMSLHLLCHSTVSKWPLLMDPRHLSPFFLWWCHAGQFW